MRNLETGNRNFILTPDGDGDDDPLDEVAAGRPVTCAVAFRVACEAHGAATCGCGDACGAVVPDEAADADAVVRVVGRACGARPLHPDRGSGVAAVVPYGGRQPGDRRPVRRADAAAHFRVRGTADPVCVVRVAADRDWAGLGRHPAPARAVVRLTAGCGCHCRSICPLSFATTSSDPSASSYSRLRNPL